MMREYDALLLFPQDMWEVAERSNDRGRMTNYRTGCGEVGQVGILQHIPRRSPFVFEITPLSFLHGCHKKLLMKWVMCGIL